MVTYYSYTYTFIGRFRSTKLKPNKWRQSFTIKLGGELLVAIKKKSYYKITIQVKCMVTKWSHVHFIITDELFFSIKEELEIKKNQF